MWTPNTREYFVEQGNKVHNGKYTYPEYPYVNNKTKIPIECPIHGIFWQSPEVHLRGCGCNICGCASYKKPIYGIGINDVFGAPFDIYSLWVNILRRCYSDKYQAKHKSYIDCSVCDEWLYLSNFLDWINDPSNGYREGCHIDKDILCKGNKVYSPDKCLIVPKRINSLIIRNASTRGDLPIGVIKDRGNTYSMRVAMQDKNKKKGGFRTPEEAFNAYKQAKESYIKEVAQEYYDRGEITKKVYDALMRYEIEITD